MPLDFFLKKILCYSVLINRAPVATVSPRYRMVAIDTVAHLTDHCTYLPFRRVLLSQITVHIGVKSVL
jgi:hypothetical protein